MLKSVRYGAARDCVRNVHWLQALVGATSTAYDTDIVEPLVTSGRLTFSAEAIDENSSSAMNRPGLPMVCGANRTRTATPAARTAPTYTRAARGSSFMYRPRQTLGAMEHRLGKPGRY